MIKEYDLQDEKDAIKFYEEAIKLYYGNIPNEIKSEAVEKMMWFYRCGKDINTEEVESTQKEKIIDYNYDANKIYAAFRDQYRINFQKDKYMHWWEFKALIEGFKEDNEINKVMSIRATDITQVPKEQKEYYTKLKRLAKIPLPTEEVEEDMEMSNILMNGGEIPKE
ncbi:bacteriophage Gp15 protein [Clostridium saccharobutylicum]|nr:bacteriophage Gp15 protein [Clostridium saccharobutylicum]